MKTLVKLLLFAGIILLINSCAIFQKSEGFQGVVTYEITYETDELSASERAQLPSEVVVYIADNKVRNDQVSAFYSVSSISDFNTGKNIALIDMMGQKIAVVQEDEEIQDEIDEYQYEINFVDEVRVIAGYRSKKAEVIMGDDIVDVFYTTELQVPERINEASGFKGIKGLLMEYSIIQGNMIIKMTVKEIKSQRVPAHKFRIPDGYEIKTPEELGGMFGM